MKLFNLHIIPAVQIARHPQQDDRQKAFGIYDIDTGA
jgi:hypothetical protein